MLNQLLYSYIILINLTAFLLMGIDKRRAKKHVWRIRERTLFLSAILGGCPGALAGMFLFRHKTRHLSFRIGMPLILIIQILLIYQFHTHGISEYLPILK